jgi:hypothetical protein
MCHALIQTSFRGDKGEPQLTRADTAEQLPLKIKEAQAKPESIKVNVFLYAEHLSTQRVEEWRSKALLDKPAGDST